MGRAQVRLLTTGFHHVFRGVCMTASVTLSHDYPYPACAVWAVATDLDHLKTVTGGVLKFRSLPSGTIFQGQHLCVEVSVFGKLPYQPYEMRVVSLDPAAMTFQSHEVGAGVKSWRHALRVVPDGAGCRIEEQIEIDAGILTPVFAAWARFLYRRRHAPRLRILADQQQMTVPHKMTPKGETTMTTAEITGFHAHVYFDEGSYEAARQLCEDAAARFGVDLGHMHPQAIGPHPAPSCQLDCNVEQFGKLLPWLISNRGDLTVFCHATSGDHLKDHTDNTFWLGDKQDLNLSIFG